MLERAAGNPGMYDFYQTEQCIITWMHLTGKLHTKGTRETVNVRDS